MTVTGTIDIPPEWAPQKAVWTAWPADAREWNGDLETPRRDVAALVCALADSGLVHLLVNGAEAEASARKRLGGAAEIHQAKYGDIWLRDTGPIFARAAAAAPPCASSFNGWGGKYRPAGRRHRRRAKSRSSRACPSDARFRAGGRRDRPRRRGHRADHAPVPAQPQPQSGWTEAEAEAALAEALGAQQGDLAR